MILGEGIVECGRVTPQRLARLDLPLAATRTRMPSSLAPDGWLDASSPASRSLSTSGPNAAESCPMTKRKPLVPDDTAETDLAGTFVEGLPARTVSVAERHQVIAARAAQVQPGPPTLSLDDVERELLADLDF